MSPSPASTPIPNGKQIVRFVRERSVDQCVVIDFEIAVGQHKGQTVSMAICTRAAATAIRTFRHLPDDDRIWLEEMAAERDSKASRVLGSMLNSVSGYFLADIEAGSVKRTSIPGGEASFNQFLKLLSELWSMGRGAAASESNLEACRRYQKILGLLPRLWGTVPGERELRSWLNEAADPTSPFYYHPASVWLNSVFVELGGSYERMKLRPWPLLLKNNGFDRPPKRPKAVASEA